MAGESDPVFKLAPTLAPQAFGGAWVDIPNGRIVVAYTDDGDFDRRLAQLSDEFSEHPNRVTVVRHRHTLAALEDAQEVLWSVRGRVADLRVEGVRLQPQFDRLEVLVAEPARKDVAAEPGRAFGVDPSMLHVVEYLGEEEDNAPRGGHALTSCSVGAHAKDQSGDVYLVTAGHCSNNRQHRTSGAVGGALHGPYFQVIANEYEMDSGPVDARAMIHGWPTYQPQPRSLVKRWAAGRDYRLVAGVGQSAVGDRIGDIVCHAGANTGGINHCGAITSVNSNYVDHFGMRDVSYQRQSGGQRCNGLLRAPQPEPLVRSQTCGNPLWNMQRRPEVFDRNLSRAVLVPSRTRLPP